MQPAELPSYYALSDVFVFPSPGDVHGLAVDEAMAAGLPVVASSTVADIRVRVVERERPDEACGRVASFGERFGVQAAPGLPCLADNSQIRSRGIRAGF